MTETYVLSRGKKSFTNLSSAQHNTSVNPTITNSDWDFGNWTITGYEIRTDTTTTFSTGAGAGNRELPAGNSSLTFLTSPINSEGYKVKLPEGITFTMDAAYDYFVVIYSTEETTTDNDYIAHRGKTHIGKITQQVKMDSTNDGFEFTPSLGTNILEGQKYQIYKGPAKSNTDVVAVSYGLLGHVNHGERYGKTVPMITPLFYFYNERLEVDNQLDYTTKYTLLKQVLSSATPNAATNSSQSYFTTTQDNGGRVVDKSPFTYNVKLIDNLKIADNIDSTPLSTLVDNTHGSNSTYTPSHDSGFDNVTKNINRSTTNNTSNLTGPKRYIEFNLSPTKCNSMPYLMDLSIKKNISKTGSFGEIKLVDSSKILDEKININDDFVVKELMFEQEIQNNVRALMPGVASKVGSSAIKITQLEKSDQLEYVLSTGENSELLTNAGGNHGIIRVNDYIYIIDSDPIDDGTRDTVNNWWYYILSIAYYRHINDKFWTAVGTLPEDFTNVNWFREEWSPSLQNLKVDFNLHKTLFPLLEYNLRGSEFSGLRLKMSAVEHERKVATISDIPTFSYHGSNSISLLSYFSGTAFVDKEIFNGSVEVLNSKIDVGGQLLYEIKGRDDIKKLLGPLVNKSFKFSEDLVYSTSSPIQDIAASNVKLVSNTSFSLSGVFAGDVGATQYAGTDHLSWARGTKLYTSDGRFIASVKSVANSAIVFEEPARIYYPKTSFVWVSTTNNVISTISIDTNKHATTKPNTLNYAIDKGMYFNRGKTNALYGIDTFLEEVHSLQESTARGYSINSPSSFNSDEPFYFRLATEGSNTTYHDIKTISSLTNFDLMEGSEVLPEGNQIVSIAPVSPFVLGRLDKNTLDTRYNNSQGLYFLNTQSLTTGGLVNFIDSKTHTSENSKKTIAINRNENNIFGSPLYKYIDLTTDGNINYQKVILDGNNNFMTFTNRMVNEQYSDIRGIGLNYATAYKFKEGIISNTKNTYVPFSEYSNILSNTLKSSLSDGTQTMLLQPPETRGYLSVLGSNFADFTYYDSSKPTTWPYKIGLEYTQVVNPGFYQSQGLGFTYGLNSRDDNGARTTNTQICRLSTDTISISFGGVFSDVKSYTYKYSTIAGAKSVYEVFDPKSLSYHLLGPCDTFNDSFNNVNNLAYSGHSYSFSDFGIMGIGESIKVKNSQTHDTYIGNGLSNEKDTDKFNTASIISSSITPSQMKRFSLGRLIELTFDLHFNIIDAENITDTKNRIGLDNEEKTYFKSRMCEKTPIKYTSAVSVDDQKIYVSRADWFKPHVAFLTTQAQRTGQLDILFNENGNHVGFVKSVHQQSCILGTALTITGNTSDANNGNAGTLTNRITTTTGNGDGTLGVDVVVNGSGVVTSVVVGASLGQYYSVGDTITIPTSSIGGSTDVTCTLPANSVETYITLLNSSDAATITSGYSSAVNNKYIHALNSNNYGVGANIACANQSYVWGMRLESDGTTNANKDTQLYQPMLSFEIGHFEKTWFPMTGALIGDDRERYMDNRFMQVDFNTEYKRFTPGNVQSENHTVSYVKQLFSEKGRYFGSANDPAFNIFDLDTYGPAYIDYSWGNAIGDGGSNNGLSFPNTTYGYSFPKLYLGFAFASHPMFNATYGKQQEMDLENGRLLTPFHDAYYYKKDNVSTTDFLSEMSGQFVDLDNEDSGGNVSKGVTTITVQDASIYDVGNKLYYYESGDVTKPVYIGIVQSVNTSTEVVTLTGATNVPIPSGTTIRTFRCHLLNYWHPSRLFQYMQSNPTDIVKYGLGNKSYSGHINEGGIYSTGNFVLLKKQKIGKWFENPANAGTSFSMRYNLEAETNVGFGVGANVLDYNKSSNTTTEGAYWQSDVFTISMKNSGGTETDNGLAFGMPIFSTSRAYTPFLYNPESNKSNGSSGPDNMNVSGLWGFKPQMVLMTSTNTAVSSAGADFSSDDRHKRIDNSDIRKITIDFSTLGLMNAWINFSPNLTGYYLVSNLSSGSNASSVNDMLHSITSNVVNQESFKGDNYFTPTYIHQILKHEVRYASGVGLNAHMIHDIWIDNATNIDATLVGYRVMKWAENCTYDFSPKTLPLYALSNKTTKHPTEDKMYDAINKIQVGNAVEVEQYNGLFTRKTTDLNGDKTEGISKGTSGTNEGVFSMYVVLDAEPENSSYTLLRSADKIIGSKLTLELTEPFYINDGITKKLLTITPTFNRQTSVNSLIFTEMQQTKGVVSYGQPFEITVPEYFKTTNLENIKIGSTFTIGNTVENILNDLMESNNIVYNKPTINSPYYISPDIVGLDLYNALTFIGNYQNLEPVVINKNISIKDKNNMNTETNITVTEGESNVSLSDKQETMFDVFNKITVYGDGVKSVRTNRQSIEELGLRELEEVDKNLRTQTEVDDRARQILDLHSTSNIQIEMQIDKTGLEYIEVGDLITIDYQSEIPVGKYMILQIHHEVGTLPKYTLGKYTAGLDFKLAEIINANRKVSAEIRGTAFEEIIEISAVIKDINIRELEIEISESILGTAQYLGFNTLIGFNSQIGFIGPQQAGTRIYKEDLT